MSTNLQRMESDDPYAGGVLVTFDSGVSKQVAWRSARIISPAIDAAKEATAQVLEALRAEGRWDEIRDTNWVSVCAAMHKCIREFNGKLAGTTVQRRVHAEALQ